LEMPRGTSTASPALSESTPRTPASAPAEPIELLRQRVGEQMYIVQFKIQRWPPTRIFNSRANRPLEPLCASRPAKRTCERSTNDRGLLLSALRRDSTCVSEDDCRLRAKHDQRTRSCRRRKSRSLRRYLHQNGLNGGTTGTHMSRNGSALRSRSHRIWQVPSSAD